MEDARRSAITRARVHRGSARAIRAAHLCVMTSSTGCQPMSQRVETRLPAYFVAVSNFVYSYNGMPKKSVTRPVKRYPCLS